MSGAIHRNLYRESNTFFSPPFFANNVFSSNDENRLHAPATRSLSSIKAILEITNNLSAACLPLYFHFGLFTVTARGKNRLVVVFCELVRIEMIFNQAERYHSRSFFYEKLSSRLFLFAERSQRGYYVRYIPVNETGQLMDLLTRRTLGNYSVHSLAINYSFDFIMNWLSRGIHLNDRTWQTKSCSSEADSTS